MSATATSTAAVQAAGPAGAGPAGRRRRVDPWKTSFFVVAVVALAGGVAWALLGSSFFVVRSIRVVGAGTISVHRVIAAAGVKIGTPLIRVDTAQVARRVERITQVQSARVRRSWPDSIVISAVPRTPTFVLRDGAGYDVMDSYGVILRRTGSPRSGLVLLKPLVGPPAVLRGNAGVLAAGAVVRRLPAWLRQRVAEVKIRPGPRVVLILVPRVTVMWGDATRAVAKAEEVAILLRRTKATYFDVSDPGSAVTGWPASG